MPHTQSWLAVAGGAFLLLLATVAGYLAWRAKDTRPRVVCFGDSLTSCGGPHGRYSDFLANVLPQVLVVNRGISGNTLEDGRRRFRTDVLALRPEAMVIALGANDWKRNERPIEKLYEDFSFMVRSAREAGIEVVIAGTFGEHPDPAGRALRERHKGESDFAVRILEMERQIAREFGCGHLENMQVDLNASDCWDSGGHPNAKGNRLIAARILPLLKEALARAELRKAGERGI
jgi:lysophospholipase L1-like esterase